MKRTFSWIFIVFALSISSMIFTSVPAYADTNSSKAGVKSGLDFLTDDYEEDPFSPLDKQTRSLSASGFKLGQTFVKAFIALAILGIIMRLLMKKNGQDLSDIKFGFGKIVLAIILFFGMFTLVDLIADIAFGL
ncbi:hypothetical protein [Vallitalea guaymasensis]|uniref:hypothetical protein n=1 Tax=Vallitalea guaymasensis TaxID=1185412 RepID=UPI000DE48CC5|nr:hypothetical protein [Vallitalea guaymasensis]